jgi:mannose-6-phosphate isomerase-like protein (cupin superfamily)
VLPPGASLGTHRHQGLEEIFYVMQGEGPAEAGGESAAIRKGEAVPIMIDEPHAMVNTGTSELEFMVIGIAMDKEKLPAETQPSSPVGQ